jgi:hypothetical protein
MSECSELCLYCGGIEGAEMSDGAHLFISARFTGFLFNHYAVCTVRTSNAISGAATRKGKRENNEAQDKLVIHDGALGSRRPGYQLASCLSLDTKTL